MLSLRISEILRAIHLESRYSGPRAPASTSWSPRNRTLGDSSINHCVYVGFARTCSQSAASLATPLKFEVWLAFLTSRIYNRRDSIGEMPLKHEEKN